MPTHQSRIQTGRNKKAIPQQKKAMPLARGMDQRPTALAQARRDEVVWQSPQVQQLKARQEMVQNSPRYQAIIQRMGYQANASAVQAKANKTGLPNQLKTGVENLSGISMDDVKVHYNSAKPAQLQAHAYAQGTDIHLGPGQEKHLPHEAWHVVQQKQGRVQPTMQMKGKVQVNDDAGLEREADLMGAKAMNIPSPMANRNTEKESSVIQQKRKYCFPSKYGVIQRSVSVGTTSSGAFEISGRPEFKKKVKQELIERATESGEEYIAKMTDPETKASVVLPTIHRRHKVAWDLWKKSINIALERKNIIELMKIGQLSRSEIGAGEAHDMVDKGDHLIKFASEIFNASWNLWMGPGDANIKKGGSILNALEELTAAELTPEDKEKNVGAYDKLKEAVFDPRDVKNFAWNEDKLGWDFERKSRMSLGSSKADHVVENLMYYVTDNSYAKEQAKDLVLDKAPSAGAASPFVSTPKHTKRSGEDRMSRFRELEKRNAKPKSVKVNINTADIKTLQKLKEIGAKRAGDIEKNRPYASLEDLRSKAKISQYVINLNKDDISF